MKSKVKRFIDRHEMIRKEDRILVAVSGGADSVGLLCIMDQLYRKKNAIFAVHINHMLREQTADRDEMFVRKLCHELDIPLKVYREDVASYAMEQKMTLEEAGRAIRYKCFEKSSQEWSCNRIAVAHHEDDQAETVLFRLIRGTGLHGLAAMRPVYGKYIRPLLCVSKSEITEYLDLQHQEFVTDETNDETEFSRNYIRNIIIPQMAHMNGKAVRHIADLSRQALDLQEYISEEVEKYTVNCTVKNETGYDIDLIKFRSIPSYIQKEVLRHILFETAGRQKDIGLVHIQAIYKLIEENEDTDRDKILNMPYDVVCRFKKEVIHFYYPGMYQIPQEQKEVTYVIQNLKEEEETSVTTANIRWKFAFVSLNSVDYTNNHCVKYFDYDKISSGICVRNRRSGDYLSVDRQGHKKSLRRYFIDAKIPQEKRASLLLLSDGDHIIWIPGGRISEAYKVTQDTKKVLRVAVEYL